VAPAPLGRVTEAGQPAVRVFVYPGHLILTPGQTQQACAYFQFPDGTVGRRSADMMVAACDSIWRGRWKPAARAVTLSQQLAIDARCPTEWSATGGTVGEEGLYHPAGAMGEFQLAAESPGAPCPGASQPPAGMTHRRWRVSHRPGGGVTLAVDPRGEWNTMADLLAWRVEAPFQPAVPQLASVGR